MKKTAQEWCKLSGLEIVDPDGFRGSDGVTVETPIKLDDFWARFQRCTTRLHREVTNIQELRRVVWKNLPDNEKRIQGQP